MPSLILQDKFHNNIDQYQVIFTQLIVSEFFPWTFLVLVLTSANWKRFIVVLMIVHYILRSVGDMHERSLYVREQDHPQWPFGNSQWMKTYGIASVLWHASEIIGDWYLLLRTKAIIKNRRKLRWIFVTCLIYNLVKCFQINSFLSYVPFRDGFDELDEDAQNAYYTIDMADFKTHKWTNVALQQLCSLAYDLSVIIALRKYVFYDKDGVNLLDRAGKSFLKRFKQISEYRIILSLIVTICGIPLMFTYAFYVFYCSRTTTSMDTKEKIDSLNSMVNDSIIDPIRTLILNFSYTFMYIDQVLLRFYVEKQQSSNMSSGYKGGYGYSSGNTYVISSHSQTQSTPSVSYNYDYETKNLKAPKPSFHSITFNNNLNDTDALNPKSNYYNYNKYN